ncbi:MAG: ABC transporter permease [Bacteroidales bacterium]
MKLLRTFILKEFYHIFRDRRTMLILLVMPIILIILFGYAITNEIKSAPIGVIDLQRNDDSRRLTEQLSASDYFILYDTYDNQASADLALRSGAIAMAIKITDEIGTNHIQIQVDATDPNQATQLAQYAQAIISTNSAIQPTIAPITHLLYNPQMRSSYNFVPGVMGLILILICAMMTSICIVREKETGTMELLLASPIKPIIIIISKAAPYLLISIINVITILLLAKFILGVPINGSVTLLMSISILYSLLALCLGLLISTIVDTQQAAMLISGVVLMLPIVLLSGMIFPIENMPTILQVISNIVPAKWYILAIRGVMIKGLTISQVWSEIVILTAMLLVIIAISVKRFKIRL